jgi:hypothetical protein
MATVAALPNSLSSKLASVASKMARLRLLRAGAWSVLLLSVAAGIVLALDAWLAMPTAVRVIALLGWAALAVACVWNCIRAFGHSPDANALAALIESQYPNLAERLSTSVELADVSDDQHGSKELISLLIRETDLRARQLNFLDAAPESHTRRLAWVAAGVLALVIAPAIVWPNSFGRQVRRFFLPFVKETLNYEVVVKPENAAVAKGQPLNLSAYVRAMDETVSLPTSATLVMIAPDGKKTRLGMKSDQPQVFHHKINSVNDSFKFVIESGRAVSPEYTVTAVEPVQLSADSPVVTIVPPEYARKNVETTVAAGLSDLSALQYSKVQFSFQFVRPAQSAWLEWQPFSETTRPADAPAATRMPLILDNGNTTARLEMTAKVSGRFSLVLVAEQDIRTELPGQTLTVVVDRPPAFIKVTGVTDQPRVVGAYETVPIDLSLADDYGIDSAVIEYRLNNVVEVQTETLTLDEPGAVQVSSRHALKLSGKVKDGDTFHYRLRIMDNRNVPEAKLTPHLTYFPADNRWLTFRIANSAEPLRQQEILAQRDDIRKRLDELINDLNLERNRLYRTKMEAKKNEKLLSEPAQLLQDARKMHSNNERTLGDLARDVGLTPDLRMLANRLQDVGDQEMRNASVALQQAEKQKAAATPRDKELVRADSEVESAIRRLEDLKKITDKIAQSRLDDMKLQQLAERQQQLADQAKNEADKNKAEELAREQAKVADELRKLTEQSEAFKEALNQAQAENSKEMAQKAQELAQAQRELANAMNQTQQDAAKKQLAELAKKQRELAEKAAQLAKDTQSPAKAAQTRPLDAEKPKDAADALDRGDANQALTRQEQTAQDLDRLGNELDRAIRLARDPREAARQLARLQDELKNRVEDETRKTPLANLPADQRKNLEKEQNALEEAAKTLSVPESNQAALQEKKDALDHAAKAADALKNSNKAQAQKEMNEAKQSLERLAERLPTLEQRLAQARQEVAKLRRQQDEIARQAEAAARPAEKDDPMADGARRQLAQNLADAARKQAEAADKLSKLDLPAHEERQEKVAEAMQNALQDLLGARAQDIPATQQDAKRQLERLEQSLNGQRTADEKAADLAKQQQKIADAAARMSKDEKTSPEKARELQNQQRQVAQDLQQLQAQEAPQRHAEAQEAVRQAEQATRNGKPDEIAKKTDDAAQAMQKLAHQLAGKESPAERADRLAKKQSEMAAEADRLAKKPDAAANYEAKKKQQQIQDEAKQLRAGTDAAREKQKASEALAQLSRATPEKQPAAAAKAAEALRELADKMAGKNAAEKAAELAREQRQLANDAAKPMNQGNAEAQKRDAHQAANRQSDLARQMQRLNPEAAKEQARQAAEAMQQARQALEKADNPGQAQQQLAKAADAAEKLANELSKQAQANPMNPAGQPQRPTAEQLAQQQRQLQQETSRAQQQARAQTPEQQRDGAQQLTRQQQQLNQQLEKLPAGQQPKALEQARSAMNQAEQALAKGEMSQAQQKQQEAAKALDQMARQQPQTASNNRNAQQQQQPTNSLPNRGQVDQARQLAQQQRELRDEVQRTMGQLAKDNQQQQNNPLQKLADEQKAIAQQAQQMAQQAQQQQGQQSQAAQQAKQAAQAAQQAAQQLQSGAAQQAQQSGQQAQQRMQQMAQNNKGDAQQQAQKLSERQEAVNRQLEKMANDSKAQTAQQAQQQQNLTQQAQQLQQQMQQQADRMSQSPAKNSLQQAAQQAQQAQQQMQNAQNAARQGNQSQTNQSQQQAAQSLDRAAQMAQQASQQQAGTQQQQGNPQQQAGQSLQQAQNQMGQAQQQLRQGQQPQAQGSMQQAANSLQQAAQQMAQQQNNQGQRPQNPSDPNGNDGKGNEIIDLSRYGKDAKKYAGKPWGDLPGELKTRIIQDMKAQYGDDYSRMIKLYFEQLADRK